ncbi:MAG: hypothetical protein Q9219_005634 [cf. Caloplaca sp. 3 TL-2023]
MIWHTAATGKWISAHSPSITSVHLASALPVLQETTFFASISWILYRILQIWQKPVDELVDLLGLDIPAVPDVSLAGITSDSVLLYWKPADNPSATLKNTIQVNGIKVGEFGIKDTSIQVTGLKPGHCYNIRVIATNSANFSTIGPLIRLRTVQASDDGNRSSSVSEGKDDPEKPIDECQPAGIRAGRSQSESLAHIPIHQVAKEGPLQSGSKRIVFGRRVSPVITNADGPALVSSRPTDFDEDDSEEAIQRLTKQLDRLRHEQHETDKQIDEEDREHLASVADLSKDRDHLRQALKEKEESVAELKKHGGHLEKTNRAAQNKKMSQERILTQKQHERNKMKEDIDRWDDELAIMRQESNQVASDKDRLECINVEDIKSVRKLIGEEHSIMKALEDEIRLTGVQIKTLEKDRERANGNNEDQQQHGTDGTSADSYSWEVKMQSIYTQLSRLWHTLQQVGLFTWILAPLVYIANGNQSEAESLQAQDRLKYWASRRSKDPSLFAQIPNLDVHPGTRPARVWRQRQVATKANTTSFPFGAYSGNLPSAPYNPSNAATQFPSPSPFFNMSNGMAVPEAAEAASPESFGQSFSDNENLTGGGAMSPAANDLLPSNLFRDEDIIVHESPAVLREDSVGGVVSELMEAGSNAPPDNANAERRSPGSPDSRRGSLLSSPHGSLRNLHNGPSSVDAFVDNDRLSIHSTGASALHSAAPNNNPLITSRLAQIFPPFNRQRGKSSSREPPLLGTLKQGQSQSFPRNMDQEMVSSVGTRQRRGSYGNWAFPMAGLLNRHATDTAEISKEASSITSRNSPAPRSRLNVFGSKVEVEGTSSFREMSSSRPSSMYSFDQILGRPSSDSQQLGGWPVAESTPSRGSPLNTWSTPGGPWSRGPSRRPSVQHGSTSNLSIGSTPLDSEAYDNILAAQRSEQLPIGTRPRSSQRFSTPKLNPAAPTFKTIFGRSEARKAAKAEKANEKAAERERTKELEKPNTDEIVTEGDEEDSSQPRLSRDAGSITTAGSAADSHDSLDRSTSAGTSEVTASSATRESFMQKITRKSSSNKFTITWGKERGGLFSRKMGESSTADEPEEDLQSEGNTAKSGDGLTSMPQQEKSSRSSLSWPNMRRKSKKSLTLDKTADSVDDEN